jgi:hypothetical protein
VSSFLRRVEFEPAFSGFGSDYYLDVQGRTMSGVEMPLLQSENLPEAVAGSPTGREPLDIGTVASSASIKPGPPL